MVFLEGDTFGEQRDYLKQKRRDKAFQIKEHHIDYEIDQIRERLDILEKEKLRLEKIFNKIDLQMNQARNSVAYNQLKGQKDEVLEKIKQITEVEFINAQKLLTDLGQMKAELNQQTN